MPAIPIAKLNYTHQALVDLIIAQPGLTQRQYAAHFGYTEAWISTIIASDAFQVQLAARRDEIVDPILRASAEERYRGLALQSLAVLQRKLESPQVSDHLAIRAAELGARVSGFGERLTLSAPPGERLEVLAERLNLLLTHKREVLDVEDV